MKRVKFSLLVLATLLVMACTSPAETPTPAAGPAVATIASGVAYPDASARSALVQGRPRPTPRADASPPPTRTPRAYPGPQTMTVPPPPTETAARTPTPTPIPTIPAALPDLDALHWEVVKQDGGTLKVLAGLATGVLDAAPSLAGQWWAVSLLDPADDTYLGYRAALYVLDSEDEGHWMAGRSDNPFRHRYAWLSDGRLLWVDGGNLLLAEGSSQNRRQIPAPEPVYQVWLGAKSIALVGGKRRLWRLDIARNTWDAVEGLSADTRPIVSPWSANLTVAPDGSFAALIHGGSRGDLWRIPLTMGEPAEWLAAVEYAGQDARPLFPPYPLADSPYWFIKETCQLLDTRDGTLRPVSVIWPEADASRPLTFITLNTRWMYPRAGGGGCPMELSPDARWMALASPGEHGLPGAAGDLYIAPSSDLNRGHIFANVSLVGWQREPAAAFLVDRSSDPPMLVRVPLLAGEPIPLLGMPAPLTDIAVAATSDVIFTAELAEEKYRLHVFTPDGTRLQTVDLPTTYGVPFGTLRISSKTQRPTIRILRATISNRTLLAIGDPDGEAVWLFDFAPDAT